ncbi:MAG TPA: serine/threonine-protein kinase [Polyangiaceae bacterium]|jgi:serine/threonine-protein kinase|nr:serine/threonine-protein kinase [Polyangiaceae bacterium]
MTPEPDQVVDGRYRLLKKIGAGAHGVVFRARDLESRGDVAIKFLSPEIANKADYVERLRREALAMAMLRGTSAVYVHGLRRAEDGSTYLIMEYLQGQNLQTTLETAEARGGQLKAERLIQLLRPIASTLSAAHGQSIVHRDLKPSNIFVLDKSVGGGIRLLDFGLVKLLDQKRLTLEGQVAGTPSYISPEGWRGNPLDLDHRIDVYAMGVIVFRALSGRVPFSSKNLVEVLNWASKGERPSLHALRRDLPPDIDIWVNKALAAEPEQRFQTIEALWSALEGLFPSASRPPLG